MAFGGYVIGDEILLGKREDRHLRFLAGALARRGLRLAWCQYLGDDRARLAAAFAASFASGDVVFSFGGIGATPDDHTRQAAAAALGVPLVLHPQAEREIRARFGAETTPQRLKMGEFPAGAEIVPNPFNRIPGFAVREHWFVPGFPQMAWPMVEWVLDTRYRHLVDRERWAEDSVLVYGLPESAIAPLMEEVNAKYPGVKSFSLPSMSEDGARRHIELGVRGAPGEIARAMEDIRRGVSALGGTFSSSGG
ncbi:MAG: molybdopterin-binding protein [Burkholderiales bacterium]|nr:molybdopterin-binding protein [Burkholderiales bacterium]